MKFTMNGYEVEINAKKLGKARNNKNDTNELVSDISIWLIFASDQMRARKNDTCADQIDEVFNELYEALKANGYYSIQLDEDNLTA